MTTRNSARHVPNGSPLPDVAGAPGREAGRAPWLPGPGTSVMVITASPALQGEVGRVSAAAAVGLVMVDSVEQSGGRWDDVAAILIGSDVAGGLPGWRGPTVVVGTSQDSASMWQQASRLGADRVAVLPDSAQWLANYLTRLRDPREGAGVLGVIGGCGGAGASTLATLVAAGSSLRTTQTLLVDGDEWGGGLDLAVAGDGIPGLRWPDLLNASGAINPEQLAASLPQSGGMSLLSWGREHGAGSAFANLRALAAAAEVLRAARDAYGLVVVDLGRSAESVAALGAQCDGFVVVVPGRLRAAAAAECVLRELPPAPVGVVARGPLGDGVDARLVADAVGFPCLGVMPHVKGIADTLESGRGAEVARRRKVRAIVEPVLGWVYGADAPVGPRADGRRPRP
ncbi:secretion/DNA translocation related CpaE-like protein [Arthrobacter silviterrae]|uniref:Rv3660c-like CheY-like N-terminal domain-containing protein n=1 Tax=Arthrobacter silviterrae TaxID=2026658 RepID=A0ABX0DCU3_9MICC|nr:septum site-determining protein Ssd [Arthrobacter silviterrae]MDQ0277913.1 secretion/DNA translocation related CpaE-like protein [Arthrobacter silviterrae]NGN84749.1 hypothetical protein [Arthrobacter silviterrae]